MLNDPKIQGILKQQRQKELFQKNRELQEEQGVQAQTSNIIYLASTEQIVTPSLPLKLPFSWFSIKYKFTRFVNSIMTWIIDPIRISNWLRRNDLPKIKPKNTFKKITELYVQYNTDLAAGNLTNMTEYCAETAVLTAQAILKKRPPNSNIEYQWAADNIKVSRISYRHIAIPLPVNKVFLQISCKITSVQTMKIISKKTKEVLGGVTEPTAVVDYFGFEKNLDNSAAPIVIVSKFNLEEIASGMLQAEARKTKK